LRRDILKVMVHPALLGTSRPIIVNKEVLPMGKIGALRVTHGATSIHHANTHCQLNFLKTQSTETP
jgi:hypothetical protein